MKTRTNVKYVRHKKKGMRERKTTCELLQGARKKGMLAKSAPGGKHPNGRGSKKGRDRATTQPSETKRGQREKKKKGLQGPNETQGGKTRKADSWVFPVDGQKGEKTLLENKPWAKIELEGGWTRRTPSCSVLGKKKKKAPVQQGRDGKRDQKSTTNTTLTK